MKTSRILYRQNNYAGWFYRRNVWYNQNIQSSKFKSELKAHSEKPDFFLRQAQFLGLLVIRGGIQPAKKKVENLQKDRKIREMFWES